MAKYAAGIGQVMQKKIYIYIYQNEWNTRQF